MLFQQEIIRITSLARQKALLHWLGAFFSSLRSHYGQIACVSRYYSESVAVYASRHKPVIDSRLCVYAIEFYQILLIFDAVWDLLCARLQNFDLGRQFDFCLILCQFRKLDRNSQYIGARDEDVILPQTQHSTYRENIFELIVLTCTVHQCYQQPVIKKVWQMAKTLSADIVLCIVDLSQAITGCACIQYTAISVRARAGWWLITVLVY